MQKYIDAAFSSRPVMPLSGAKVTVTTSNGDLATLYSDNAGTLMGNPIYTDSAGNYSFYAADGRYTITIAKTGFQTQTITDVLLEDPSDQVADLAALQLADYAVLRQYTGTRKSVYLTGYLGTAAPSGIAGMFVVDDSDTTSVDNGGTVIVTANGKRWKRQFSGPIFAKWFVVGDGLADDYPNLLKAVAAGVAAKTVVDVGDLKIYLASQSSPINLDGLLLLRGSGELPKPALDPAYINGADLAASVWAANRTAPGSAFFSPYNGPMFTGKTFPVRGITCFCDYNKPLSQYYRQSTPTAYPGWSQAITRENSFSGYYCGSDGVTLLGGLELVQLRHISIWFCGGWAMSVGMTAGINCPIEYVDIDATCSFIYGRTGNLWLNGFRRNVRIAGCLVNGAGQYDVRLAANPAFTVAAQTDIVPPIRVTGLAAGTYGGVNHSGSDQLIVEHCYAEVAQGILQTDGAPINSLEVRHNTLIPWNSSLPKNLLSIQNAVYRLRTSGNANIDGTFYLYIAPGFVSNAADYLIEEATVSGGVSFVGSKPLDPSLTPPPGWCQQSGTLGDGTATTATYNVAIHQVPPINAATVTSLWEISANFQDVQFDRRETVIMAVSRHSSGNYTGQLINQPPTTQLFSAAPTITAAGVIQIPLTLYSRARVTRIDKQPVVLA